MFFRLPPLTPLPTSRHLVCPQVAFKFAISDSLPKISYQTTLDFFMNSSFYCLALIFAESAVLVALPWVDDDEPQLFTPPTAPPAAPPPTAPPASYGGLLPASWWAALSSRQRADHLFGLICAACWLLFHVCFQAVVLTYTQRVKSVLGEELDLHSDSADRDASHCSAPQTVRMVPLPHWPKLFRRRPDKAASGGGSYPKAEGAELAQEPGALASLAEESSTRTAATTSTTARADRPSVSTNI